MVVEQHFGRVLIVEDDADMAALLKNSLEYDGFRSEGASDIGAAKNQIERFSFDAVLLDLHLGEQSGLELIPHIARVQPFAKIIVMTAFGSIDLAVDSMEQGATTFITKSDDPQKITEELKERLASQSRVEVESVGQLATELGIIGNSRAVEEVIDQIDRVKDVDATVLLLGESGTGKELIARAIHILSDRKQKLFEAINCGAIPENLLESELFGYKKGAFTDARTDRKGMFETCSDGTLFLDEIGEMPLNLQVKLLRVLQEKEVRPIGSSQSIKVGTRVICATNKNLEKEVKAGRFREDLYFRLSVIPIMLPALRERREDIPLLVEFFIARFNDRYKRNVKKPTKETMTRILAYDWPGNIRELQNCIERAIVLSKGEEIELANLFLKSSPSQGEDEGPQAQNVDSVVYQEAKETFERNFLKKILSVSRGNISEAARISGRFRSDIYRLMEKYGIKQQDFR